MGTILFQSLLPKFMGRKMEPSIVDLVSTFNKFKKIGDRGEQPEPLNLFKKSGSTIGSEMNRVMNNKEFKMGESPSFGGHCSARCLAKMAACMASKGQMPNDAGCKIMSEETWEKMHANPSKKKDALMGLIETNFTQGGVCMMG
jgi:hypothetical protein